MLPPRGIAISSVFSRATGVGSRAKNREIKWGCTYRIEKGRHNRPDSKNENEDVLLQAYLRALNKVAGSMDDYLQMIRENCSMVMKPKMKREIADIDQEIIDIQEAVLELHKQKQQGLLTVAAFNKRVADHKARMESLQERQKQIYEKQGNTLAVEYWLNQFQDATDRLDEASIEPTVIKTLVEKMVVDNQRRVVDIHFKCGVIITETI